MPTSENKIVRVSGSGEAYLNKLQKRFSEDGRISDGTSKELLDLILTSYFENYDLIFSKKSAEKNEEIDSEIEKYFSKYENDFSHDEIKYLLKNQSSFYPILTLSSEEKIILPDDNFYNEDGIPCRYNGVPFTKTPFGYFPLMELVTKPWLSNPDRFKGRLFKERDVRFQRWYGLPRETKFDNYDYDKDYVNFLHIDYISLYRNLNLDFNRDFVDLGRIIRREV
ncbi:MAG: hypothetical protein K5851_03590 [Lachnospiraceae bacterium]|nr:hypothetical protein [Lachnospiraceae bacterium]